MNREHRDVIILFIPRQHPVNEEIKQHMRTSNNFRRRFGHNRAKIGKAGIQPTLAILYQTI